MPLLPPPKKSRGTCPLPLAERYALIDDLRGEVGVRTLCRLLEVSRSGYYARETSQRDETALRAAIEDLVLTFPGYGYRRVTKALQRAGWTINHKRVLRVMGEESLLCHLKRAWITTTDSTHHEHIYPNLILGRPITGLNQVWVADITYVRLPQHFVYLATILDAYSRKVIGWALSRWIDTALTLHALDHALATRVIQPGVIHHSDRGVQYAARDYVQRLVDHDLAISMSAKGNPYHNARAESFFKTLKQEEVYLKEYRNIDEAYHHLNHFISDVYNTKRLHSSLDYRPPVEFEDLLLQAGAK